MVTAVYFTPLFTTLPSRFIISSINLIMRAAAEARGQQNFFTPFYNIVFLYINKRNKDLNSEVHFSQQQFY